MRTDPQKRLRVTVIDGQGGNIGRAVAAEISERVASVAARIYPDSPAGHESEIIELTVIGTNSLAAENMAKVKFAGMKVASGENPIVVASRTADVIIGALGIVIADSMLGEITPRAAFAVSRSSAERILIPLNRTACGNYVAGVGEKKLGELIHSAVDRLFYLIKQSGAVVFDSSEV